MPPWRSKRTWPEVGRARRGVNDVLTGHGSAGQSVPRPPNMNNVLTSHVVAGPDPAGGFQP
jgi:hypothetical protein